MTQQGKFEYKLTIGSYSSETAGQLQLLRWKITEGRDIENYPKAEFALRINAASLALLPEDQVRFYRREYGEASWGSTFFFGIVTRPQVTRKNGQVTINAEGYLREVGGRTLSSVAWGNAHIVDKVYPARIIGTDWAVERQWTPLDAGLPAQTPLESVKVCILTEMVNGGHQTSTVQVYNNTAPTYKQVAQCFYARNGTLRRFWIKGYRGGARDLKVSLQYDTAGSPSGVEITTYTIPYASFGAGSGNESWVEVDLLEHVADPSKLVLQSGSPYWLVFSLPVIDPTVSFNLRVADSKPTPQPRIMKSNIGSGWTFLAIQTSLYFAIDFEGDWTEMHYGYGQDYEVWGSDTAPLLLFVQIYPQVGDPPGMHYFMGRMFPVLYDGQNLIRVSYWRGYLTYATVYQYWAQALASDLYNTLDISITEPATKQYCIKAENADGFAIWKLMRQFAAVYVRIYENAASQVVLEIRDERNPDSGVWAAIYDTDAKKNARTFVSGFDSPASPDRVRIIDFESYKELLSENDVSIIKDQAGNIIGAVGSGAVAGSSIAVMGGFGGMLSSGQNYTAVLEAKQHAIQEGGKVTLSGTDQTSALEALRTPNELVKLTDSKLGWAAKIFAVQSISWSGGGKSTTKIDINFVDTIMTVYTPTESPGGPSIMPGAIAGKGDFIDMLRGGLGSQFSQGSDGRMRHGMAMQGATDAPQAVLNLSGSSKRETALIMYQDLTIQHQSSRYWWLRVGTGTPTGHHLGIQIADVQCQYQVINGLTYLTATITPADITPWTQNWPKIITEMGVAWSYDEHKTGLTEVGAYTIGIPSGSYTIFAVPPELGPDGKVTVMLKVLPSP